MKARLKPTEPVGSKIPGSLFLRDYCARCGDPIRVSRVTHEGKRVCNYCHDCDLRPRDDEWKHLTPAQKAKGDKFWAG